MGKFEEDFVVDQRNSEVCGQPNPDPDDLPNPVVLQNPIDHPGPVMGLLVMLGAVDEKNSDYRQGDYAERRN